MLALVSVVLLLVSSRDPSRRVTLEEFGPAWPLTIASATLTCAFHDEITVTSGGATYSLNRWSEHGANSDVAAILADTTGGTGKMDLTPLIEAGLKLCE